MGVPAFFRWIAAKFPSILVYASESSYRSPGDEDIGSPFAYASVDLLEANVNGIEFDNLYLDMNGIIHPCTHPTDRPAPRTESEMMIAIYEYIDRLMAIVRPRKLLYMAVDGVAPRAKLNQQRARRFRSGQERLVKMEEMERIREGLGMSKDAAADAEFDSNCITPGTGFMWRLSAYLRYYVCDRMERSAGWAGLKVILSDATVPGEGEHKVMDFIRKQRCQPGYDPNTRHCLCGADADLIMLGLASHEPHFAILREEYVHAAPICDLCSQRGHTFKECQGAGAEADKDLPPPEDVNFFFIRLDVVREYLEHELVAGFNFDRDLEKCIDDWVFICFLVGNDFLPNLPCLEIREHAIDKLVDIYRDLVNETFGTQYFCTAGVPNMPMVERLMEKIAGVESQMMLAKRQRDQRFAAQRSSSSRPAEQTAPEPDDVRLGEHGFRERYYVQKFKLDPAQVNSVSRKVAADYAKGLCWVLQYYYSGCPAWDWYYPHHYAPFASDFLQGTLSKVSPAFPNPGKPFTPMQQLMAVYPPSSAELLPPSLQKLMLEPDSPIIEFYPENFEVDRNGKRFDWQAVVLLDFIDQSKLLKHVKPVEQSSQLTDEEKQRNLRGSDMIFFKLAPLPNLFISQNAFKAFCNAFNGPGSSSGGGGGEADISLFLKGIFGSIKASLDRRIRRVGEPLDSPIKGLLPIPELTSVGLVFRDPELDEHCKKWLARLLPNVVLPEPQLKMSLQIPADQPYRPSLGFGQRSRFRADGPRFPMSAMQRTITNAAGYGNRGERGGYRNGNTRFQPDHYRGDRNNRAPREWTQNQQHRTDHRNSYQPTTQYMRQGEQRFGHNERYDQRPRGGGGAGGQYFDEEYNNRDYRNTHYRQDAKRYRRN